MDVDSTETGSSLTSFISQPMQLFIEDTDAYGVKYNANYIRSYERALHQFHCNFNAQLIDESNDADADIGVLLSHSDFYLTGVTLHKFKASPALGSPYVITAKQIAPMAMPDSYNMDTDEQVEYWSLEMLEYQHEQELLQKPKVYNTAIVTISQPNAPPTTGSNPSSTRTTTKPIQPFPVANENNENLPKHKSQLSAFTLYRDEFDFHMPGVIPIKTALNLFERSRSNSLGGPAKLRQMQEEDNILWVVTSIDDLQIDVRNLVQPGQEVRVRSHFAIKRKGMIIECRQEVLVINTPSRRKCEDKDYEEMGDDVVVLAQGVVTLCAIDSIKGRPTSNIPDRVRALLE